MLTDAMLKRREARMIGLAGLVFLGLGSTMLAADARVGAESASAATGSDHQAKPAEPAECPIKKTIGGKTYCFQNDPALTKPQGGQ